MIRVRFAPSPTGYLHVGNIRTALVNWLFAKANSGEFLLRIDDTDLERSRPEYEAAIREDLTWLGLSWNSLVHQSKRFDRYALATEKLKNTGRLYPCYETPDELETRRKFALSAGRPPVYDRAALKLGEEQKAAYEKAGRKPHWRFLLEDRLIQWTDLVRGEVKFQGNHMSDPVLIREDGMPVYTLASVVDDGELGITHVLRGEDHVSNTAVQVQIYEALGFAMPQFGHFALIKTKAGGLSKRTGGGDIRSLRKQGILPMAINAMLSRLGTSQPIIAVSGLEELAASFDIAHFGRSQAIYDEQELQRLNTKLIAQLSFDQVKPMLANLQLKEMNEHFWHSIRGNIANLEEAKEWWQLVHAAVQPVIADAEYTSQAGALLPQILDSDSWQQWTNALKEKTGRKGKELFLPLRLALTGREDGPELKHLLGLMDRARVLARLEGKAA